MTTIRCVNYYDLCRICTGTSQAKINVFSAEARKNNLSIKIAECLSLNIDERDRLPKVICSQCQQNVYNIIEFRNVCKNSQTILTTCLNTANIQNGGKLYIQDSATAEEKYDSRKVSESGANITNVTLIPSSLQNSSQTNIDIDCVDQLASDASSTVFAKNLSPQNKTLGNNTPIKTDNNEKVYFNTNSPNVHKVKQHSSDKEAKQAAIKEFLKLKPNIKVTQLSKKDHEKSENNYLLDSITREESTEIHMGHTIQPAETIQHQQQQILHLQQIQQQLQQQIQQQWQQQQLQQQLQQISAQLQQQIVYNPNIAKPSHDPEDISKVKKPKLDLVLTPATTQQKLMTSLHHIPSCPSQIQLQIPSIPIQPNGNQISTSTLSALTPLIQTVNTQQQVTMASSAAMISPDKCLVPITIKGDSTDQQIIAHIDAKSFMFPTTYKLQMNLHPHIAVVDGQPVMQLAPASIPATIQLASQSLATPTIQPSNSIPFQPQILQLPKEQLNLDIQRSSNSTSRKIISSIDTKNNKINGVNKELIESTEDNRTKNQSKLLEQGQSSEKLNNFKKLKSEQNPSVIQSPSTLGALSNSVSTIQKTSSTAVPSPLPQVQSAGNLRMLGKSLPESFQELSNPKDLQSQAVTSKITVFNKPNITISRIPNSIIQKQEKNCSKSSIIKPLRNESSTPLNESEPVIRADNSQNSYKVKNISGKAETLENIQNVIVCQKSIQMPNNVANQSHSIMQKDKSTINFKSKHDESNCKTINNGHKASQNLISATAKNIETKGRFECNQCGREFKKREHLTQHVKLHTGIRPFKCGEEGCDKAFNRKEHLLRHLISHSGRKNFSCEVCQKPFSRKDNLHKHRRIHLSVGPVIAYTCETCKKTFSVKEIFEEHKLTHQN